jgi:hypothetical protein
MVTIVSNYRRLEYGDYIVMPFGTSINVDLPIYNPINHSTFKISTNPWFSVKSDENDDESIPELLERWNIHRDNIPYKSVKDFVESTNGRVIINNGMVDGDFNACGLISLFGTNRIDTDSYRCRINSRVGQMLTDEQLGDLAKAMHKKIYFLYDNCGTVNVIIMGSEKSKDYVVIHATKDHFQRVEW